MKIRRKKIRLLTEALLADNQIKEPFVPVDLLAKSLGIRVEFEVFDDRTMSGCIIRKGGSALICINANDHDNRQRFTLAHEIGHYILHKEKEGFVDKGLLVHNRNLESSKAIDPQEIEANYFAAELLMPKKFLEKDLAAGEIQDYDALTQSLAQKYHVSPHAMALRLAHLGHLAEGQ